MGRVVLEGGMGRWVVPACDGARWGTGGRQTHLVSSGKSSLRHHLVSVRFPVALSVRPLLAWGHGSVLEVPWLPSRFCWSKVGTVKSLSLRRTRALGGALPRPHMKEAVVLTALFILGRNFSGCRLQGPIWEPALETWLLVSSTAASAQLRGLGFCSPLWPSWASPHLDWTRVGGVAAGNQTLELAMGRCLVPRQAKHGLGGSWWGSPEPVLPQVSRQTVELEG